VLKHKDMGVKLSQIEVLEKCKLVLGNNYTFPNFNYINMHTKVDVFCNKHDELLQITPANIIKLGTGCRKCGTEENSKRQIEKSKIKFYEESIPQLKVERPNLSFEKFIFEGTKVKSTVTCSTHGDFLASTFSLTTMKIDCPDCAMEKRLNYINGRKVTFEDFKFRVIEKFGDKIILGTKNQYKGYEKPFPMSCKKHGDLNILPQRLLLNEHGCYECSKDASAEKRLKSDKDKFKIESFNLHGGIYSYELVHDFKSQREKVKIICPVHGEFNQTVSSHLQGRGCVKCSAKQRGEEKIKKFGETYFNNMKELHQNKYEYPKQEYLGSMSEISFICPNHGLRKQKAMYHAQGGGCQICGGGWSKKSLLEWIRAMREQLIHLDRVILLDILVNSKVSRLLRQMGRLEDITTAQIGTREVESIIDNTINELENLTEEQIQEQTQTIEEIDNDEDVKTIIENRDSEEEVILPIINPIDELDYFDNEQVLNNTIKTKNATESIDFYKKYYTNKVWNSFINGYIDLNQYDSTKQTNELKKLVMDEVISDYEEIKGIKLLNDFIKVNSDGSKRDLTLMQKLVTVKFRKTPYIGNWSDTGTGKTLGALYSTRDNGCKNIIIVCLNSNVDTWKNEINSYFTNNKVYTKWDFGDKNDIKFSSGSGEVNYLILNVETFQQENVDIFIKNLTDKNGIDAIIVDEVQSIKTRDDENISIRTQSVLKLVQVCREINNEFKLMLMSATPIINNFNEPKNLIELLTGVEHNDINVVENIPNGLRLFKFLTRYGIRFRQKKQTQVIYKELELDGSSIDFRTAGIQRGNYLQMEQLLLPIKLEGILPYIVKGETIIYTEYVTGIKKQIREFLNSHGISVGFYTGEDKEGLIDYRDKNRVDVLVGSKPITTGINGLQFKTSVMITLIPMWTKADDDQFRGRVIDRKGIPVDKTITYITPIVNLYDNGELLPQRSQYSRNRVERIKQKGILSDLVMDGVVPKGKLPSRKKLLEDVISYFDEFERMVNNDEDEVIYRKKIEVELNLDEIERLKRELGDFSEMNRVWSVSNSKTTGEKLNNNPEIWKLYHTLYREKRQEWNEIPYEVIGKKISSRPDWVVGDFGCGENLLSKEITNKVHAFDHIAIDETVTACDISNVPLKDNVLDVVVFSLSLMGTNYRDYLVEGHRTLRPFGLIMICEPKSKWEGRENELVDVLREIGFTANVERTTDKFIYVEGNKRFN
jgi:hypothetical protein